MQFWQFSVVLYPSPGYGRALRVPSVGGVSGQRPSPVWGQSERVCNIEWSSPSIQNLILKYEQQTLDKFFTRESVAHAELLPAIAGGSAGGSLLLPRTSTLPSVQHSACSPKLWHRKICPPTGFRLRLYDKLVLLVLLAEFAPGCYSLSFQSSFWSYCWLSFDFTELAELELCNSVSHWSRAAEPFCRVLQVGHGMKYVRGRRTPPEIPVTSCVSGSPSPVFACLAPSRLPERPNLFLPWVYSLHLNFFLRMVCSSTYIIVYSKYLVCLLMNVGLRAKKNHFCFGCVFSVYLIYFHVIGCLFVCFAPLVFGFCVSMVCFCACCCAISLFLFVLFYCLS